MSIIHCGKGYNISSSQKCPWYGAPEGTQFTNLTHYLVQTKSILFPQNTFLLNKLISENCKTGPIRGSVPWSCFCIQIQLDKIMYVTVTFAPISHHSVSIQKIQIHFSVLCLHINFIHSFSILNSEHYFSILNSTANMELMSLNRSTKSIISYKYTTFCKHVQLECSWNAVEMYIVVDSWPEHLSDVFAGENTKDYHNLLCIVLCGLE